LIDQEHQIAIAEFQDAQQNGSAAAAPWETIAERVRSMGVRLQLSEVTFPIHVVLPLIAKYHVEQVLGESGMGTGIEGGGSGRNPQVVGPVPTWVVDIFISLGVPFETLVTVLEGLLYGNEAPWTGRSHRGIIGSWMVYVVRKWFEESLTAGAAGGVVFGGDENALAVLQTLRGVENSGVLSMDSADAARVLRARIEGTLR
jgi:nuclear pore complex protein Nup155